MQTLPDAPATVERPATWDDLRSVARELAVRHTGSVERRVPLVGVGVAVVQALVLSLLALRGYWYTDDLDNLAAADEEPLGPGYLGSRLNDHLVPGLRLAYWLFAHVAPLDWTATVVVRGVLQLVATLLLLRLLLLLLGSRPLVLVGLVAYAASPLLVPSFMSLSSGVNLLPSHVAGLAMLICVVRWRAADEQQRARWLVAAAVAFGVSLCFWEKSGLVVLSAAALVTGPLRGDRSLRRALRDAWPLWSALAVPVAAFALAYSTTGSPDSGRWPGVGTELRLVGRALWEIVAPAAVGGPWRWSVGSPPPFGLADPPVLASILGAVVLVVLVVAALRRGRDALPFWAAVLGYVVATVVSVSVGRLENFGTAFLHHYHYWSDLAIPLVLAVVLSLRGWLDGRTGPAGPSPTAPVAATSWWVRSAAVAWLVAAASSHVGFAQLWSQSPTRSWLDTLVGQVTERGGTVNLYDTTAPTDVLTLLAEHRRLSDVLGLTDLPVVFDSADSDPLFVDDDGALHPGELEVWARSIPGTPGCGHLVQGRDEVVVRLDRRLPVGTWFARVGYLANPDADVGLELVDGATRTPLLTDEPTLPAGLLTATVKATVPVRGDRVVVTGRSDDVNLCVDAIAVGLPRAAG